MDNNKPWYEKFGIWIAIIASICTILAFTLNLSDNNNRGNGASITINGENDDSINNTGDNPIIVGGDINVNSGNNNSEATMGVEFEEFKVTASYDQNISPNPYNGIDVLIKAETYFAAKKVTITAISDEMNKTYDMHGGPYSWSFNANFYAKGEYTIVITAYNSEGKSVSDEFSYIY